MTMRQSEQVEAQQHQILVRGTLNDWSVRLRAQNKRQRTIDTYKRNLTQFIRWHAQWYGAEPSIHDMDIAAVENYYDSMAHLAGSTIQQRLSTIRSWSKWAIRRKYITTDPTLEIEWPERTKGLPRALKGHELMELDHLLSKPAPVLDRKGRRLFFRNTRIILIMLYTGLRRFEVATLTWNEIDLHEANLTVRDGKGGTGRVVPIHPRLHENLIQTPRAQRYGAVAGHKDGRCLSHKSLGHIFEDWLPERGIVGITAHRLRHSCATEMLRHGSNLRDIQLVLGHADIRTTERYLDLIVETQRIAVNNIPNTF
jgi:integrase/recombinase XerD